MSTLAGEIALVVIAALIVADGLWHLISSRRKR